MTSTMQTTAPLVHQTLDSTVRMVRELARLVRDGDTTLDAPYQRGDVWTVRQQRDLIRSWMLGLPVPSIIVNARWRQQGFERVFGSPAEYAVIDGKQRLTAAVAWFYGDLSVPASWFKPEDVEAAIETDDGPYVTHGGLARHAQLWTANRFVVPVAEASARTVADEAFIFGLINGGGVPQTDADMARAARVADGQ